MDARDYIAGLEAERDYALQCGRADKAAEVATELERAVAALPPVRVEPAIETTAAPAAPETAVPPKPKRAPRARKA